MIKVNELFYVYSWSKLDFSKQQLDDNWINFVSRNSNNNWIVGRVVIGESMKIFKKWDISVPLWWSFLLSAFVQQEDFVTAQNVAVLRPKNNMSEIEKWFYCYALRLNKPKFVAFGREVNKYINDIELPDTIPDWIYKANISKIITNNKPWKYELKTNEREAFKVWDLFEVWWSKTTPKEILEDIGEWDYPYVTTSASNNWIEWFYNIFTEYWNVIVVESACMWYSTYQNDNFSASDHVEILKPKYNFNKYIWLFIAALINNENFRYSYWRKCNQTKINNMIIKLPVDSSWNPDREFMENYIKNLPYWDRI